MDKNLKESKRVTELEKQPILCQVLISLLRHKTQSSKGEKNTWLISVNIHLMLSLSPKTGGIEW